MTSCLVFIQNLYTKDTEVRNYTSIAHAKKYLSDQAYLAGVLYSGEKTLIVHPRKITISYIPPTPDPDRVYLDDSDTDEESDQEKCCLCC